MSATQGVSIVCVFNNRAVREECLDASITRYDGPAEVDFVPVDNTAKAFPSAGAALNHAARLARFDTVVFVHQDVYLHDIDRLVEVGQDLHGETWGILGACGVEADGAVVGLLRDRVQLCGRPAPVPVAVDSLDEVLFLIRRDRVLTSPLSEDPDLAWHAYAVEYAMRMRDLGLGVGAVDCGITHNSLTVNLDRLDVAHRRAGDLHPAAVPTQTTCGRIGPTARTWRELPLVRDHKWRLRWLRNSLAARRVRRVLGVATVIADIRLDVDALAHDVGAPLHVLNLDDGPFISYAPDALTLSRFDRPVRIDTARTSDALQRVAAVPEDETLLVTNVGLDLASEIVRSHPRGWVGGVHEGELWLLGGIRSGDLPADWAGPRAVPLGADPVRQPS